MNFDKTTIYALNAHARKIKEVEIRKLASSQTVPTSDIEVKTLLRKFGNPIHLFGESPGERRERLRYILARNQLEGIEGEGEGSDLEEKKQLKEVEDIVYTAASKELIAARKEIAEFSFNAAAHRTNIQGQWKDMPSSLENMCVEGSQVENGPVRRIRYSNKLNMIATCSNAEYVTIWDRFTCTRKFELCGHEDKVFDICFSKDNLVLSAGFEGLSSIWKVPNEIDVEMSSSMELEPSKKETTEAELKSLKPIGQLTGHERRLAQVSFHPINSFAATTSYDYTWRLWDIENQKELLLQDGHNAGVHSLAFHPDGSIICTGDTSGLCLLWDLRSGSLIHELVAHARVVSSATFSPDGGVLATAGADHFIRVYDLRSKNLFCSIPAHNHLVSQVSFLPNHSREVFSSGFDSVCKLWAIGGTETWEQKQTFKGHEGKVSSFCFGKEGREVLTSGFDDKTWKIWT
eukprot:maker-scaffold_8-snap-gene-7.17-mRNA-1 protein AED:0.02 eAED:0.02 QI:188/1/1/1/1/1/2/69/460